MFQRQMNHLGGQSSLPTPHLRERANRPGKGRRRPPRTSCRGVRIRSEIETNRMHQCQKGNLRKPNFPRRQRRARHGIFPTVSQVGWNRLPF